MIISDQSGRTEARIVTEGEGIKPGSAQLGKVERDIRMTPSTDDPIRDQIQVDFLPLGAKVRLGAVVYFNIESIFQAGVELTVYARNSIGNVTNLAPPNLVSSLQTL